MVNAKSSLNYNETEGDSRENSPSTIETRALHNSRGRSETEWVEQDRPGASQSSQA